MNAFTAQNTNINLAFNKTASQSYTIQPASLGVDGRQDTYTHFLSSVHPWWSVDLGAAYDVGQVTVTNFDNERYGTIIALYHGLYGSTSCYISHWP